MQTKSASALFCLWLATALLWGCSSGSGSSASLSAGTVSGVVTASHPSHSASANSEGFLSRVASLVMPPVRADITGLVPVAGATVQLVRLNSAGAVVQVLNTATTDSNGVYTFTGTPPVTDSSLAIQAQDPSDNTILMRAIVTGPIVNVSPATEAVTAELLSRLGGGVVLDDFMAEEVAALYSLVQGMDVDVSGLDFPTAVTTIRSQAGPDSPFAQLLASFESAGTSTVLRNNAYSLIDFSSALRDGVVLNNGTSTGVQLESGHGAALFGSDSDIPLLGVGISYGVFDYDLKAVTFERGAGQDEATEPLPSALGLGTIMHVVNNRGQLVTADTTNGTVAGGIGALTSDGSLLVYPTQIISRSGAGALGFLEAGIRFGARAFLPNGQQSPLPLTLLDAHAGGQGTHYHQVGFRESLSGENAGNNAVILTTLIGETIYDSTGEQHDFDDGLTQTYGSFASNNSTDKLQLNIDSRGVTTASGSEVQNGYYYIFPNSGLVQVRAGDGSLLGFASTPVDGVRNGEVIGSHAFSDSFADPMLEADRTFSVAIRQATNPPVVSGTYNVVEYGGYLNGDGAADPPTGFVESAIRYGTLNLSGGTAGSSSLYQTRTSLAVEAAAPAAEPNASGQSGVFTTAVAGAAGEIFTLGVGGISIFTFSAAAAGDQVAAADIQAAIDSHAAAFATAGITVGGTVVEGNLVFTRADGAAFEITVTDTFTGTPGGFAGADFTAGTHAVSNGSTVAPSASLARASAQQSATGSYVVNADGQMTLNLTIGTETVTGGGAVTQSGDFAVFAISSSDGTRQGRGILFLVRQ